MKKLAFVSMLLSVFFMGTSFAADIILYHAPNCPHCHHAREFITNTLVYEYPELKVTAIDVTVPEHRQLFRDAVEKCGFTSGGVPVLVIGDKCEQGYADYKEQDLRNYVEADLTPQQKSVAAVNRQAMAQDMVAFKEKNAHRNNVVVEYDVQPEPDADVTPNTTSEDTDEITENKTGNRLFLLGGLLILIVAGLGYALVRKSK